MRREKVRIKAFTLEPTGEPATQVACSASVRPGPGQAVFVMVPGSGDSHRQRLFPTRLCQESFISDRPPDPAWSPGMVLDLLGPVGRGFAPPAQAERWLLISLGTTLRRLWPLVDRALEQEIALSIWSDHPMVGLPPQVEIVPELEGAISWADYLALETDAQGLENLRTVLGLPPWGRLRCYAEALILTAMPCGIGACQGCGVEGERGVMWACRQGPVFDLERVKW